MRMVNNDLSLSLDVNECATENPCVQTCVNTYGSFICRCDPGYELEDDGVRCSGNGLWHLETSISPRGWKGWRGGVEDKGFLHRCFLCFPRHPQFGTFPRMVGSQPHKAEMSHFPKGGVESPPLSFDA